MEDFQVQRQHAQRKQIEKDPEEEQVKLSAAGFPFASEILLPISLATETAD
jgi:hypothetical protein